MTHDDYIFFWGSIYSNWYPCEFRYKGPNGEKFNCSEQAFMYEKAVCFNDMEAARRIMLTKDPSVQKQIGKGVKGYDDAKWAKVRFEIMYDICLDKFSQNEDLKRVIISTGKKKIVEASPYDKIWGIGLAANDPRILDESKWQGQNLLGEALMGVRSYLRCEKFLCEGCGEPLVLGNMRIEKEAKKQMEEGIATWCPRYRCLKCNRKARNHLTPEDYEIWYSTPL